MNKLLQNYVKIAIIGMVASGPAHAQMLPPWSTVDFFQAPGLSASASDVGTSADGLTLFSVGSYRYNDAGDACAIVRTSTDSGATWAPAGTPYLEPGWQYATYQKGICFLREAALAGSGNGVRGGLFPPDDTQAPALSSHRCLPRPASGTSPSEGVIAVPPVSSSGNNQAPCCRRFPCPR